MTNLKRQLIKKIIGIASFGVLLVGVIWGTSLKEINLRAEQDNDYLNKTDRAAFNPGNEIGQSAQDYNSVPEEVETSLFVEEYNETGTLECMSVGCGGFF
jgi:hypothetical protein